MATIFSTMGPAVRTVPLTAQGTLDVSGPAFGAYLVRMEEGEQVRTVPFIKE